VTHAALSPLIGPEFDKFLYAPIVENLSVLSALARLDIDPWQEAVSLARMPRDAAAARLSALIEAQPHARAGAILSRTSAADLIALLPNLKAPYVRSSSSALAAAPGVRETRVLFVLSAFVVMMLIVCALATHFSPEPRAANSANAPTPPGDAAASPATPRQ
jgi:hypothetical protein